MSNCDIGLVGLAVMGQNLVLNMNDHGYRVAVYNRTSARTEEFLNGEAKGCEIEGAYTLEDFISLLKKPRLVMILVKAGDPVDLMIEQLMPLMDAGDLLIDAGNSYFRDTIRRYQYLKEKGIHYIGTGVSGGELGARFGPSITPGGASEAWPLVKAILQGISAKVDGDVPCCEWMGPDGAGHYVKMVHNGIEYGFLQLIAETYHILKDVLKLSYDEMSAVFGRWAKGKLSSYLIEVARDTLGFKDTDGQPMVSKILDSAGQKGTGRWTSESALELGIPLTLVTEAVFARVLSAFKSERMKAADQIPGPDFDFSGDKNQVIDDLENALYLSEIISYTQGFMLFRAANGEFGWELDFGTIANIWRNGCIIRSALLTHIRDAFERNAKQESLLLDPYFQQRTHETIPSLRRVVSLAAQAGIPIPAYGTALSFFDGYRSATLPANLTQAQRDYFGSHTYERVDKPRGEFFHTDWTGEGGDVTASSYNA
ncbi:MAG: decarboxylating NADP(+)-dependent phosphogluconate dehydrogenase [Chloroflexi bacterium]|nr:decarboxylating NADP(+)-dependent phosphogluconate dehydrogenase [Chloroflexota bacterium]